MTFLFNFLVNKVHLSPELATKLTQPMMAVCLIWLASVGAEFVLLQSWLPAVNLALTFLIGAHFGKTFFVTPPTTTTPSSTS